MFEVRKSSAIDGISSEPRKALIHQNLVGAAVGQTQSQSRLWSTQRLKRKRMGQMADIRPHYIRPVKIEKKGSERKEFSP